MAFKDYEDENRCCGRARCAQGAAPALGLKPGQVLEIRAGDGRLELEIAPMAMVLKPVAKA